MKLDLQRSYATCGANLPSPYKFDGVVLSGILSDSPWAFSAGEGHWTGVLPNFMYHVGNAIGATIVIPEQVISEESSGGARRLSMEADHAACLKDVAVGRLDMCMAGFWVTEERILKTAFLPPIYQDKIYLVKTEYHAETVIANLVKPFRPFTFNMWIFSAILLIVLGMCFSEAEFGYIENRRLRCCAGIFYSVMSYLRMESTLSPATAAGMTMGFGIMFFVLLSISAFTANLTTFLMMRRFSTGVESLEDAINFDFKICAYPELGHELAKKTLGLQSKLIYADVLGGCAKHLYNGDADAAIMSEVELNMAYAGKLVLQDCAGVDPGSTDSCPGSGGDLELRRDCDIEKIDQIEIATLNVAMPISAQLQQIVGWSLVSGQASALLDRAKLNFSYAFPQDLDDCRPDPIEPPAVAFNIENLQGSTVASMVFVMVGWVLMAASRLARWHKLRQLAAEKGHELTEEEIAAFDEAERRKQLAEGDTISRIQLHVEDCSTVAHKSQDDNLKALQSLDEQLVVVIGKIDEHKRGDDMFPETPSSTKVNAPKAISMESPQSIPPELGNETNASDRMAPYQNSQGLDADIRDIAIALDASQQRSLSALPQDQAILLTEASRKQQEAFREQWRQVEEELRQEQLAAEKLWRDVTAERMRLRQEWADLEMARRKHSDQVRLEHISRLEMFATTQAASSAPNGDSTSAQLAKSKRKAQREQTQDLQKTMNMQMEDSWADLRSQRASHREDLRRLQELQAETAQLWRKVSKAQDGTGTDIRMLAPYEM
jgi:hypothetical protein